jgi:hypothetical protein
VTNVFTKKKLWCPMYPKQVKTFGHFASSTKSVSTPTFFYNCFTPFQIEKKWVLESLVHNETLFLKSPVPPNTHAGSFVRKYPEQINSDCKRHQPSWETRFCLKNRSLGPNPPAVTFPNTGIVQFYCAA